MKREFLINILLLIGINLLIKPVYIFGIDRGVQNAVGKEEFGLYFTIFNFTYLLQIINDFGIHTFNNKHIAQNRDLLKTYFPNVLMLKTMLALLYLFSVLLLAIPFGYLKSAYLPLLLWLSFIHLLNSLMLYLRSNISALGWYRTDSFLSSLHRLLMIGVLAPFLWVAAWREQFELIWFIYAQVATLILTAIITLWILRKKVQWQSWSFDFSFLKRIAKESYPYALAIFLMTVYTRIDSVMIERMLPDGKEQAGIYAGAYRLLDAANMIGFLFAGLLLPMFARLRKEGGEWKELLIFSLRIILSIAIALSIPVFFWKEEIMILLYLQGDAYWGQVLGWLMLSFIAGCIIYVYSALLTAADRLMKMNVFFVIGIFLNILLNYVLIPYDKAAGAALATLLTQSFIAIALVGLAVREFRLPHNFYLIVQFITYAFIIVVICYMASHFFSPSFWKIQFIASGILAAFMAFIFRLLSLRELARLVKK